MCARQQGDLCEYKDKCDEEKGLYCDFSMDDGLRGICRGGSLNKNQLVVANDSDSFNS